MFVAATLVLASFLGVSAANGQDSACPYTLASLQGSYSVIGNNGANVAIALGMVSYDGNGNLASSFVVNEPTPGSTTGARTLVTGTQAGAYTVSPVGARSNLPQHNFCRISLTSVDAKTILSTWRAGHPSARDAPFRYTHRL